MLENSTKLDTTIEIVTPENIAFRYRVAGPFRRFPAYLIDVGIRMAMFVALLIALGFLGAMGGGALAFALILIGWFVIEWFYGALFETYMNGQTPGKRMMGLRVLTIDGLPINGLQAVIRNLLRLADTYPLLSLEVFGVSAPAYVLPTFLVGLAAMTFNRRFQRLGDLVCGTMVVVEERRWLTGVVKLEDPRAARLAEYLPADFRVSRSLAQALATYVERRRYFTQARRREVARYLAEPLLARFGLREDTSYDLLLCALYHREFIADRREDDGGGSSPFGAAPPAVAESSSPFGVPVSPTPAGSI